MGNINWDLTVDTIRDAKCILFLGPEVFTNAKGERLDERLLAYLKASKDEQMRVYDDGLFFFKERSKRTETYLKIRRFFEQEDFSEAAALFDQIARIPFHFIIGVTPESLLQQAFQRKQLKVRSEFYWKKQASNLNIPIPTCDLPLIYNMLGSIERPESLVLTHSDLFDYLESIFQGNSLSNKLRDHILSDAQSIIFLGVPLDRWYMQLILRLLHLHKNEDFMRFADTQSVSEKIMTFGKEEFKINFIPNNISEFIQEIYQRCEKQGLLREIGVKKTSFVQSLIGKLALGQIADILQSFKTWLEALGENGMDLLEDTILLSNRHRRLHRKLTQGIISHSEADLETNKITSSLLGLLNEAKGLE